MIGLKLTKILATFTREEWKEFEKFIASPYFNKGRNYVPLTKELKKYSPDFSTEKISETKIYNALYPNKKYNSDILRTHFSNLSKLAEEFLIQQGFKEKILERDFLLLNQLNVKNLDGLHKIQSKKIENTLERNFGSDSFNDLFIFESEKISNAYKGNYDKVIKSGIPRRGEYLVLNFIVNLLTEIRDLRTIEKAFNYEIKDSLTREVYNEINYQKILDHVEKFYPLYAPQLLTTVYCYLAAFDPTDEHYEKAKEMVFKNYSIFSRSNCLNLFLSIEGVIQDMLQLGHRKFIRERFLLHKFMVEKKIYIFQDEKYIHPRLVINFIINSIWNKEFVWLGNFISNHEGEFSEKYRSSLTNLGFAYLKYFESKPDEALTLLSRIENQNFDIRYRVTLLRLFIYSETKEYDAAFNSLDSFRHFARTHKNVTGKKRNEFLKISNNVEALIKYKSGDKTIDLEELRKIISKDPPMLMNDLILEKINEIVVEEKG